MKRIDTSTADIQLFNAKLPLNVHEALRKRSFVESGEAGVHVTMNDVVVAALVEFLDVKPTRRKK